jgi:hypothetical protein
MFVDTVVLTGTIVIEGIAFHWSVANDQRLVVSHDRLGTRTEQLVDKPEAQARVMGRALLAGGMDVDAADDLG